MLVFINSQLVFSQIKPKVQHEPLSFKVTLIKPDHKTETQISLKDTNNLLQLFIFLSPECPISKNYTLTLNKLFQQYNKQVKFYGCISGKGFMQEEIISFINTYKISYPIFIDEVKKLTNYLKASVTPEVILVNYKGETIYSGAIDNWLEELGKQKVVVSKHYLEDAITASINNKEIAIKKTTPHGCFINDY